jgi:hypothetical protein
LILAALTPLVVGAAIGWVVSDHTPDHWPEPGSGLVTVAYVLFGVLLLALAVAGVRELWTYVKARPRSWRRMMLPVILPLAALTVASMVLAGVGFGRGNESGWDLVKWATLLEVVAAFCVLAWRSLSWRWFWHLTVGATGVTAIAVGGSLGVRAGVVLVIVSVLLVTASNFSVTTVRVVSLLTVVVLIGLLARIGSDALESTRHEAEKLSDGSKLTTDAAKALAKTATDAREARDRKLATDQSSLELLKIRAGNGADPVEDPAPLLNEIAMDTQTLATLKTAEEAAQETVEAITARRTFLELVGDGASELVHDTASPLTGKNVDVAMSPGGWVAVLLALCLVHRKMEIQSGLREVGPIVVDPFVLPSETGDDKLSAYVTRRLRDELARASVWEPASVPTADAVDKVATVASTELVPSGKWVSAVAKLVRELAFPLTGFVVVPTYDKHDDGKHHVTIALKTARRGHLVSSRSVTADSLDDVILKAAACIAQGLLSSADTVPQWSEWPEGDGTALECYLRYLHCDDEKEKRHLKRAALRANPGSGLLQVLVGMDDDVDGDHVEALGRYLSACRTYPTFIQARYRSAISLQTVADQVAAGEGLENTQWEWIGPLLSSALSEEQYRTLNANILDLDAEGSASSAAETLLVAADHHTGKAQKAMSMATTIWRALFRPDERTADLLLISRRNMRQRLARQIQIVDQLVGLRRELLAIQKRPKCDENEHISQIDKFETAVCDVVAQASHSSDLIRYNVACFYAVLARGFRANAPQSTNQIEWTRRANSAREKAMEKLWEAYRSPGGNAPKHAWYATDPDLSDLRGWDRFERFLRRLEKDEASAAASAKPSASPAPKEKDEATAAASSTGSADTATKEVADAKQ